MSLPNLRFPEFRNAPEWSNSLLGEIAKITSGGTPNRSKKDFWTGSIPWVTTSLIDFNIIRDVNEYISEMGLKESSAKIFPKDTILMAMYGQGKTRGKVAMLGIEATTNQACAAILLKKNISTYFAFQNLSGRYDEIRDLSNRGGQENLSAGLIEQISFPYPVNIEEQQKIADCLSSIDELITAQTQKLDTLKMHKKGLMQQLFPAEGETVPKLRFPEFRDAGEWEENPLGKVCSNISSGKDKIDVHGSFDLYGSTGVIGKTSNDSYHGYFILVARVGANAGLLTRSNGKFGVTDNTLVIVLKASEKIDFIYYSLDRLGLNKMVFGSGQPLITGGQLKSLVVTFPSSEEQEKIADCLASVDELIAAQAQKIEALKQHKKGLMQQLFPVAEEVR